MLERIFSALSRSSSVEDAFKEENSTTAESSPTHPGPSAVRLAALSESFRRFSVSPGSSQSPGTSSQESAGSGSASAPSKEEYREILASSVGSDEVPTESNTSSSFHSSQSSDYFSQTPHAPPGAHDENCINIIAYDYETQRLFDEKFISWPVQWLLALGQVDKKWTWEDIRCKINSLQGDELVAGRVNEIMGQNGGRSQASHSIWYEYQREQQATMENAGRGCGLMGLWKGIADWHGGQIQQLACVEKDKSGKFSVRLQRPEQRRSHRIARFFGSRRVIILRVGKLEADSKLRKFIARKFVLLGRVFEPFHAKENNIYLIETSENWGRTPVRSIGDQYRVSFNEFRDMFNPITGNGRQPISKWSARWAILLSNSVPAIEFAQENIYYEDDIYADGCDPTKKAPSHQVMTDGCGRINATALIAIARKFCFDALPAAVQGRIGGSKGLWILHPTDRSPEPKIWIRSSQLKINLLPTSTHKVHRTLDFLAASKPTPWCFLSSQPLLNLSHGQVPHDTLRQLMRSAVDLELAPFMDWTRPNAMIALCDAVGKSGGLASTRIQRQARCESRALGYRDREFNEDLDGVDEREQADEGELAAGRNPGSGMPISVHEVAYELLQAGFHPSSSQILLTKLQYVIKLALDTAFNKYKIPVEGVHGYAIPDPLGVLNEGEIYYHSSRPMVNPVTMEQQFNITGPVLIGRYPIRLPSDIQKVHAVVHPELQHWMDVVILSTRGSRSAASLLSGGDYDGDDLFIIKDQSIVAPFQNSPFTEEPHTFLETYFDQSVESADQFVARASELPQTKGETLWREQLIHGLGKDHVGIYSNYHEASVFMNGYGHAESIRLGYMFNTLLDSGKTGLRLKDGVRKKDSARYDRELPVCMKLVDHGTSGSFKSQARAIRSKDLDAFVLEDLFQESRLIREDQWSKFEAISPPGGKDWKEVPDQVLLAPYTQAKELAQVAGPIFQEELQHIECHVQTALEIWSKAVRKDQSEMFSAAALTFAAPVPNVRFTPNVEDIKASIAYSQGRPSFAFSMGFRALCRMKAESQPGGLAPIVRLFDEMKILSPSAMRALSRGEVE